MTVEVAILNKHGVALAADSAATSGTGSRQKIFHTLKLFTLSKWHPVGIMTYSSADLMGLPAETAIKAYRNRLGRTEFTTLEEYAEDFKTFLRTDKNVFDQSRRIQQCRAVVYGEISGYLDQIDTAVDIRSKGQNKLNDDDIRGLAKDCLSFYRKKYSVTKKLPGYTDEIKKEFDLLFASTVRELRAIFRLKYKLSSMDTRFFKDICSNIIFCRTKPDTETGFVIAGFGRNDYLPKLVSFEFVSSILGMDKIFDAQKADLSIKSAQIVPFAQPDMVETFVRGRSKGFDAEVTRCAGKYFEEQKARVASSVTDQGDRDNIIKAFDAMKSTMSARMNQLLESFTSEYYVQPIESTVSVLPKSDLAIMAEALVNLTALKRRVMRVEETVGGPIDVAVISKGDGFVWIKRKHYFEPKLNHTFLETYMDTREQLYNETDQQPISSNNTTA